MLYGEDENNVWMKMTRGLMKRRAEKRQEKAKYENRWRINAIEMIGWFYGIY
jgi:hypothetical protein